jgi:hypothetical protein
VKSNYQKIDYENEKNTFEKHTLVLNTSDKSATVVRIVSLSRARRSSFDQ